jgi:hypothetical protein
VLILYKYSSLSSSNLPCCYYTVYLSTLLQSVLFFQLSPFLGSFSISSPSFQPSTTGSFTMLSLLPTLALVALTSPAIAGMVAATTVMAPRQVNPEVVYAVNCNTYGGKSWQSRLYYYSNWENSWKNGPFYSLPDATAVVDYFTNINWEYGTQQSPIEGFFPDGNTFSVWGLIHGVAPGTQVGEGANKETTFVCYRETEAVLVSYFNGDNCYAIYSCAHEPHNILTTTDLSISGNIATVPQGGTVDPPQAQGVDPTTALHHFYDDLSASGLGCMATATTLAAATRYASAPAASLIPPPQTPSERT